MFEIIHLLSMRYVALIWFFLSSSVLWSQNTIGLLHYEPESQLGYTLLSPNQGTEVFLIDNCGQLVHSWETGFRPGLSCYLLDNGNLLRTKKTDQTFFQGGGVGGGLEIIDWDGNVIWSYDLGDSLQCQHHDVEYLPNGNILVIAWDLYTEEEQINAGRILPKPTLWAEKIIELKPDFDDGSTEIVWEWKVWDHLIQQFDSNLDNYGVISDHPERIDINYSGVQNNSSDWLHFNSIDYNKDLDQIMISVHHSSEIWIIDHSTTTEEAASHIGGLSGKGGDLLYRWGNPTAYSQGFSSSQKLFKQHDAYWISDSLVHGGMVMVFNNQRFSPLEASSVDIINPPLQSDGSYYIEGEVFLPNDFHWSYSANNLTDFYSHRISGAQRLTDGNTLICEGGDGRLFEIDINGNIVWEYISPIAQGVALSQGEVPNGNNIFRVYRYPTDYPAFNGKDLSPQGYIELGSDLECELYSNIESNNLSNSLNFYPNPVGDILSIDGLSENEIYRVELVDLDSKILTSATTQRGVHEMNINVGHFAPGVYFVRLYSSVEIQTVKIIKL